MIWLTLPIPLLEIYGRQADESHLPLALQLKTATSRPKPTLDGFAHCASTVSVGEDHENSSSIEHEGYETIF